MFKRSWIIIIFLSCIIAYPLSACNLTDVRQYGAKGDGITDDTQAIQRALSSKKKLLLKDGVFLITQTLDVPSGRQITGDNGVIRAVLSNKAIQVSGDKVKIENIEIDGTNTVSHGVWVKNGCDIKVINCFIHSFYGTPKDQSNAVYLSSGVKNVIIDNCRISDIDAPLNGVVGDLCGSCQGVLAMKVYDCMIRNCTFDNVKSEEDGDCIQVFSGRNSGNRWDASTVIIKDCVFTNIWHRAIKLQASNCSVSNCRITADVTRKPSAAIEVFGDYCTVKKVNVEMDYGVHALTVSGNDFLMDNCKLAVDKEKRHVDELKTLHADVVYCIGSNCCFRNNMIQGSYIGLYSPSPQTGLKIEGNEFSLSTLRCVRIYESKDSEIVIQNNIFLDARVPIEMAPGSRVKIVKNRMNHRKAVINVLGKTFAGEIKGNTNSNAEWVEVKYILQ